MNGPFGPFPPMRSAAKDLKESRSYQIKLIEFPIGTQRRCTNHFKVGDVLECLARWFGSSIFRLIPKCKIKGPQFSIAESREMSAIGGEHEAHYDSRKLASRLSR
jgi:hypothetical protein